MPPFLPPEASIGGVRAASPGVVFGAQHLGVSGVEASSSPDVGYLSHRRDFRGVEATSSRLPTDVGKGVNEDPSQGTTVCGD